MAGAYCKFCSRRCFVYRIVPDGPRKGWGGHMATCPDGMALDLEALGHTHLTAVNPVTDPEAAAAIGAPEEDGPRIIRIGEMQDINSRRVAVSRVGADLVVIEAGSGLIRMDWAMFRRFRVLLDHAEAQAAIEAAERRPAKEAGQ
jgi:hypothetical protein